jgi:hypothetical protein
MHIKKTLTYIIKCRFTLLAREQQPAVTFPVSIVAFPLTEDRLTLYNIIIGWILII